MFNDIPDSNVTLSKLIHELKQKLPNLATDFGICIVFKLIQAVNVVSFKYINEFGSVTDVSDEHSIKAP